MSIVFFFIMMSKTADQKLVKMLVSEHSFLWVYDTSGFFPLPYPHPFVRVCECLQTIYIIWFI